jgi:hypothetical protein
MRPFLLYRDHIRPAIEARRKDLEAMYAPTLGRPELDPTLLAGVTVLQVMERLSDRMAVERAMFDRRWQMALGLPDGWTGFHPSLLCVFRARLARHDGGRRIFEAGLEALRAAGYLGSRRAVRIDSTHVLADLAAMSRLECVRETLRQALTFLSAWGEGESWEPWASRYAQRNPDDLRRAVAPHLKATMERAGADVRDVLARVDRLSAGVVGAGPVKLLRRVFQEQFEVRPDGLSVPLPSTPAGAVQNPHDPDAQWSTKRSLGKAGWVGYKVQVCETAAESRRERPEPTSAVITAVVTQPAITSDHGSLPPVIEVHASCGESRPQTVFADAGYLSAPALKQAEVDGYELCGPVGSPPHSATRFGSDAFDVDLPNRRAVCPAGIASSQCALIVEARLAVPLYYFAWTRAHCATCPLAAQCLSKRKRQPFRTLQVTAGHMWVQDRRRLCRTPEYRLRMRRRNGIEGTISELKRGYGIRRCRYRSLTKTRLQMHLAATACNLRRWAARLLWLDRKNRGAPRA